MLSLDQAIKQLHFNSFSIIYYLSTTVNSCMLYTYCLFFYTGLKNTLKQYMKYCMHDISSLGEHFLSSNVRFFTVRRMRKLSISYFDSFHYFLLQAGRIRAVGIVGIERKLEEKRKETDKNISEVNTTEVSRSTTCLSHLH